MRRWSPSALGAERAQASPEVAEFWMPGSHVVVSTQIGLYPPHNPRHQMKSNRIR